MFSYLKYIILVRLKYYYYKSKLVKINGFFIINNVMTQQMEIAEQLMCSKRKRLKSQKNMAVTKEKKTKV
jgi:hypothetical protein